MAVVVVVVVVAAAAAAVVVVVVVVVIAAAAAAGVVAAAIKYYCFSPGLRRVGHLPGRLLETSVARALRGTLPQRVPSRVWSFGHWGNWALVE